MEKVRLTPKEKKQINVAVQEAVHEIYYEDIPLKDIFDACKQFNAVPLMEDQREWCGFLSGGIDKTVHIFFDLGRGLISDERYEVISNACLTVSYYRVASGRMEVLAHVA